MYFPLWIKYIASALVSGEQSKLLIDLIKGSRSYEMFEVSESVIQLIL